MSNRVLGISYFLFIAVALLVADCAVAKTTVAESYAGGIGTSGAPYQISTLSELRLLSETPGDWSKYFILTADIDATDTNTWNLGDHDNDGGATPQEYMGFSPIGDFITRFLGNFNGQGFVISNLTINHPGYNYIGVFGYPSTSATISNLGVEGGTITGYDSVGGLIGYNFAGTITSCHSSNSVSGNNYTGGLIGQNSISATITSSYATGTVSGSGLYSGGLVGLNSADLIDSCYATGTISGTNFSGGLVGRNSGTILSSYATGAVTANNYTGGLVGTNAANATIDACYATGSVTGSTASGGLVGTNDSTINSSYATGAVSGGSQTGGLIGLSSTNTTVDLCYATGSVTGTFYSGGLIGWSYASVTSSYSSGSLSLSTGNYIGGFMGRYSSGTITSCYWDMDSSGEATSPKGTGLTSDDMILKESFVGFDFDTIPDWIIIDGITTPYLPWQEAPPIPDFELGDGTLDDPYQLSSLLDLYILSESSTNWAENTYFILTANIDAYRTSSWYGGLGFSPIGNLETPFLGNVDGQEFVISNLTINRPDDDYIGLLGYAGSESSISNVGVEGGNITGYDYVGGLVGYIEGSDINSCYVTGTISGNDYVGGLIGYNFADTLASCYSECTVSGYEYVGGLLGHSDSGTVTDCYATGDVSASYDVAGGLAGYSSSTMTNSYAMGDVAAPEYAGGFVGDGNGNTYTACYATGDVSGNYTIAGFLGYGNTCSITDCYATGNVTGIYGNVAGFIGEDWHSVIDSCYATGDVSGDDNVGGFSGYPISTITNCYAKGNVSGTTDTGGFSGRAGGGGGVPENICTITNCFSTGTVTGSVVDSEKVGGFIGNSNPSNITNCYATGGVSGWNEVGGLIGYGGTLNSIRSSYSTGTVSGNFGVGGLIGSVFSSSITSCYSTGMTSGINFVGGFLGYNEDSTITSCYWDTETSGMGTSEGGTEIGLTTVQMLLQTSFTGFDFTTTPDWAIVEGETRPYLPWQTAALFESSATATPTSFTVDTGYAYNIGIAGVTLDEYGIVYHEDGSDILTYQSTTGPPLADGEAATLDGETIYGLTLGTTYWYRAYTIDSDGLINVGTERAITTTQDLSVIYVDFVNGNPVGIGTEDDPVDTLSDAVILVEEYGLIKIAPGSTTETIIIDQPVTLERNGESGTVIIGN